MKFSNSIVIGGPIAVGKSTLVGSLPFFSIQELDHNDELQNLLLEQMYKGDPIAPQVFQLDILLTRFDKYKKFANLKEITIFDRSIFEDKIFALNLLENYPNIWEYYHSIWKDKVEELIKEIGIPKIYILLICDWKTFKERIFTRNRLPEIQNFFKNEKYFQKILNQYQDYMLETFKKYKIPFAIIDTNNKTKIEIIQETHVLLKEKGLIK